MPELQRIMVVEDDELIRQVLRTCLDSMGSFTITECTQGQEALDKLAEAKPQLILLDIMMPNMSGVMTYGKIRQMPDGKNVPVIVVTARAYTAQVKEYKVMGAAAVIAKPFDALKITREILDVWEKTGGTMPGAPAKT